MAILEILTTLKGILGSAYTGGAAVYGKVAAMFGDRSVWIVGIWVLTFFNFFAHLVSSVLYTDGSQFLAALQSLGVTLGASLGQIITGLTLITSPLEVGAIPWIKGLVTLLLGLSTIYWWYKGNAWFIRFITSFDPNLVNWLHITFILVLSVVAFHDQTQFYELMNLTEEFTSQVLSSPQGQEALNQGANQTAATVSEDEVSMLNKIMRLIYYI